MWCSITTFWFFKGQWTLENSHQQDLENRMWRTDHFEEFIFQYSDADRDCYAIHAIINAEQNSFWTLKVLSSHSHRTQSFWVSFRKRIKSEAENSDWGGKSELIRTSGWIQSSPLTPPLVVEGGSFHFHHEPSMKCVWARRKCWTRKLPNTPEGNDGALGEIHLCSVISFHRLPKAKAGKVVWFAMGTHESGINLMLSVTEGHSQNMLLSGGELYN